MTSTRFALATAGARLLTALSSIPLTVAAMAGAERVNALATRPRCGVRDDVIYRLAPVREERRVQPFAGHLRGATVAAAATHSHYLGVQRVLVIRVDFSDRVGASITREAAQAVLDDEVAPFFAKSSYGLTSLVSTVTEKIYRMPHTGAEYANGKNVDTSDCNSEWIDQLHADAVTAVAQDHVTTDYDRIIVALPEITEGPNVQWAGLADYCGARIWINGHFAFSHVAHELGHTYGAQHSGSWQGTASNPIAAEGAFDCYGDRNDLMGGGGKAQHDFSAYNKWAAGWLPEAAIVDVRATGRYRIYCFDAGTLTADRPVVLRISRDGVRDFWVSHRGASTGDPSLQNGAHVAWGYHAYQASRTLDLSAPYDNSDQIGLGVDSTLDDPDNGLSIRVAAKGGSGADSYLDIDIVCRRVGETLLTGWGSTQSYDTKSMAGVRDVVAVAAGEFHSLALRADGTVWAGGWTNAFGEDKVPAGLREVVHVAGGRNVSGAVRADGSVVIWGDSTNGLTNPPASASPAVALAFGDTHALALRRDGTVVAWGTDNAYPYGRTKVPADLTDVIAIAAGGVCSLALKRDGTVVGWGPNSYFVPKQLTNVVAIACHSQVSLALRRDGTIVAWGQPGAAQLQVPAAARDVVAIAVGQSRCFALRADGGIVAWKGDVTILYGVPTYRDTDLLPPPTMGRVRSLSAGVFHTVAVTEEPYAAAPRVSGGTVPGEALTLAASAGPGSEVRWLRNGAMLSNATAAQINLGGMQPELAGLYVAEAHHTLGTTTTAAAIVGSSTTSKVIGAGQELVPVDVPHPNGHVFDQVLITGAAEAITADYALGQITRTSFIDLDGDIVQVEFGGPGTLSIVLENASGPATAEYYQQPKISYMKGHAGIVITGADERTNVSVFTVGRATAFDPTGQYNPLQPITAHNVPARNGNPIFEGHAETKYDGIADLAFIAISSRNGRFGGLRAANATFFATRGLTGVYAPGVAFDGPVNIGDIVASDEAQPVLVLGSATTTQITGGSLYQLNEAPVQVSGIAALRFVDGSDSHGTLLEAQINRGILRRNGVDVTAQIVVNP